MFEGPSLVASDFDGTFADAAGQIPDVLRDAVDSAGRTGIDVLIVTARPPRWLSHLTDVPGDAILCANGAFEYVPRTGEVRVLRAFTPEHTRSVAEAVAAIPGVSMSAETTHGFWCDPAYPSSPPAGVSERDDDPTATIAPLDAITVPAGKILVKSSVLEPAQFHRKVTAAVGDLADLHVSTNDGLAELSPPGVSKASALIVHCAARRIPRDQVWAVGDMPNDLPMLEWAGVGFAVRNAHPDVIAAAAAVAPANTHAGVAHVLAAAERVRTGVTGSFLRPVARP